MKPALEESYGHCQRLAKNAASSFYYSFLLLPRAKRQSMYALYAFLRRTDDLGDSELDVPTKREQLTRWRGSLEAALAGEPDDPLLPALVDTVARYDIPHAYLSAAIDGVEMDLDQQRYETFADLEEYCYRVASVVGLACIHIWGFRDERALEPARSCGLAFQITNILRDLKEDILRDRVYLPQEDLRRFGYTEDDLRAGTCDGRIAALMDFQIHRAKRYYAEAAPLADYLRPDGRRVFGTMLRTYRELLTRIERRGADVLHHRVVIGKWCKLAIAARCCLSPSVPTGVGSAGR